MVSRADVCTRSSPSLLVGTKGQKGVSDEADIDVEVGAEAVGHGKRCRPCRTPIL